MICGVCCLVTCLWWAIISITSWLLVPLPHNVSPGLNQRCHYGQSEDTPRPHNGAIIRLPVTISTPFRLPPLPLTSSFSEGSVDKSCSVPVFRSLPSRWHFCKYHNFYHLCCQLIIVYPKLSNLKINGFVGWKPSPENIHSALFPGQCCQECRRSSQQSSLWSIHMV